MNPIIVRSAGDVAALVAAIFDPFRDGEAIVALTSRTGQSNPALDPVDVLAIVGERAAVYVIEDGPLTRELTRLLPRRFGVFGGAARIWWPPVNDGGDPRDHPLIRDPHGVYGSLSLEIFEQRFAAGAPTREAGVHEDPLAVARRERDEARALVKALERENRELFGQLGQALERAGGVQRLLRRQRPAGTADREDQPAEMDVATAFRLELHQAWLDAFGEDDRNGYPLGGYVIGASFIAMLAEIPPEARKRTPWVCAMVITTRAVEMAGLQPRRLRTGLRGDDPPVVRQRDGALAWRCTIQRNTPGAPRLHYWQRTDGVIELASIGHHDQYQIPD